MIADGGGWGEVEHKRGALLSGNRDPTIDTGTSLTYPRKIAAYFLYVSVHL